MSTISNAIQKNIHTMSLYKKKLLKRADNIQQRHSDTQCNSYSDSVITMKYKDGVSIHLIQLYQG